MRINDARGKNAYLHAQNTNIFGMMSTKFIIVRIKYCA